MFPLQQTDSSSVEKFLELEDSLQLYRKCIYGNNKCVFVFLNGEYDNKLRRTNLDFKKSLNVINEIPKNEMINRSYAHFYYVNATCHKEFNMPFKINKNNMPAVVVFDPVKKSYAKIDRRNLADFELKTLEEFLQNAIYKHSLYIPIDNLKDIFQDKYCQEIKHKLEEIDYERLARIAKGLEDDEEEEENVIEKDEL
jgi:hypothetical protein